MPFGSCQAAGSPGEVVEVVQRGGSKRGKVGEQPGRQVSWKRRRAEVGGAGGLQ